MASHLIDLTGFVFGRSGCEFRVWERHRHELKGFDHCLLATSDRSVTIECSFLSWKNRWRIEALGEEGALEMNGLTKWGRERAGDPAPPAPERRAGRESRDGPRARSHLGRRHAALRGDGGDRRHLGENDLWLSRTVHAAAAAPLEGGA